MEYITIILGVLGPLLAKCWSDQQDQSDPQAYLKSRYNKETNKFDPQIVRQVIPQVTKAIRNAKRGMSKQERKSFPKYNRNEKYDIAEKKLLEAMNAKPEVVRAAFAVAATMGDDD